MTRDRRTYLGSTDIACILGLSPWRTPYQVWHDKRFGEAAPPASAWWAKAPSWYGDGNAISEAAWWGQAGETINVEAYCRLTGAVAAPVRGPIEHPAHEELATTPDALLSERGVLECKETNDYQWAERWKHGAKVPEWVATQALWHLACTDLDWCDVSVRVVGRGGGLQEPIRIWRDNKAISQIVHVGAAWWRKHVVEGVEPEAGPNDLAALRSRAPQGPDPIAWSAGSEWRAHLDTLRRDMALLDDLQRDVDTQRAALVQALVQAGANEAYLHGDDRPSWRLITVERSTADVTAIRKAYESRQPGRKKALTELPEGIAEEDLETAIDVLDAFSRKTTSTQLRLGKA